MSCSSFLSLLAVLAAFARGAEAQEYVSRSLGVPDGLANERVNCLLQDRKGYLWIGTWAGLSRFDGAEFVTLDSHDGLKNESIDSVVEDSCGHIWIATQGAGIARFLDEPSERAENGGRRLACFAVGNSRESNIVDALIPLRNGALWCATQAGLFLVSLDARATPSFERVQDSGNSSWTNTFATDEDDRAWIGERADLIELVGHEVRRHPLPDAAQKQEIVAIARSGNGDLLVGTASALFACRLAEDHTLVWREIALERDSLRTIRAVSSAKDGSTWIGTQRGIVRRAPDGSFEMRERDADVHSLYIDREGDVWAGTWSRGAIVLRPSLVRSWTTAEGLPDRSVARVVDAGEGRVLVSTGSGLAIIEHGIVSVVPGSTEPPFVNIGMRIVRDHRSAWWVGTDVGMYFCAGPTLDVARLQRIVHSPGAFGRVLEDRDERIVFGGIDGGAFALAEAADASAIVERIGPASAPWTNQLREFARDSHGGLWLATYIDLFRDRAGVVATIGASLPPVDLQPRCFLEDRRGRLWIGMRTSGAWRCDDPSADRPTFVRVDQRDGLPSDTVWSMAEDDSGALWFATARGLARLDSNDGKFTNFTSFDGLAGDIVAHCMVDTHGVLWAATSGGVSALDTHTSRAQILPPPIYVVRMRAGGVVQELAETGATRVAPIELAADSSDVFLELSSPSFQSARHVRFEHRLLGDDDPWSAPSAQRTIELPRLAPGHYRLDVRARIVDGPASVAPVQIEIDVLPPVWQRAWFLVACVLVAAGVGYLLQRVRLQRALAFARIRAQIATDLHDELGSGLAQIAILSEVARRDSSDASRPHLESVASLARSLRESVGEIVWAIDPRGDQARELLRRMRAVAFNLLESEGVQVQFTAPDERALEAIGLAPDQRRHLLLVLKEALTNVARHAQATRVGVDLRVERRELVLVIQDDGRGFDTTLDSMGHGLESLRRRALALHAKFTLRSAPGQGTSIELVLPIARSRTNMQL